jgi:hypothetical protein
MEDMTVLQLERCMGQGAVAHLMPPMKHLTGLGSQGFPKRLAPKTRQSFLHISLVRNELGSPWVHAPEALPKRAGRSKSAFEIPMHSALYGDYAHTPSGISTHRCTARI